jgi:5-methylcytosine-specific restriction enzyme A
LSWQIIMPWHDCLLADCKYAWRSSVFCGSMQACAMTTNRVKAGGRINRTRERGAHGRGICRWCGNEVPPGRRTFCGDFCVHEWRLRTNPGYLRERVAARDNGICARCGLDTLEFYQRFRNLPPKKRNALRDRLGMHAGRRSFWDADHIVPVAEGGGECDLSNLRTLCLWCHQDETVKLQKRLSGGRCVLLAVQSNKSPIAE